MRSFVLSIVLAAVFAGNAFAAPVRLVGGTGRHTLCTYQNGATKPCTGLTERQFVTPMTLRRAHTLSQRFETDWFAGTKPIPTIGACYWNQHGAACIARLHAAIFTNGVSMSFSWVDLVSRTGLVRPERLQVG